MRVGESFSMSVGKDFVPGAWAAIPSFNHIFEEDGTYDLNANIGAILGTGEEVVNIKFAKNGKEIQSCVGILDNDNPLYATISLKDVKFCKTEYVDVFAYSANVVSIPFSADSIVSNFTITRRS